MLADIGGMPLVGELTCQINSDPGLLSPDKCALDPVPVPYSSTKDEFGFLVVFALPSLEFLIHHQRHICRKILLPIPLLELGFVELLPFGSQPGNYQSTDTTGSLTRHETNIAPAWLPLSQTSFCSDLDTAS